MNPSLAADARALALLGELLDGDAEARAARLGEIERTDPPLHQRVQRLLRAAADDGATQQLAGTLAPQLPLSPRAGDTVAGYRLLRELGRGGMATVWLARRADGSLDREVALKLPMAAGTGVLAERFARERDVVAGLDHEHIARLYDAGVDAGRPYIVLEAVHGQPITDHARQQGLDRRARLQLFLQVLAAVDHAHRRMVVHRDLKPSNILVDAQGRVKLLDFGIAKLLAAPPGTADLTQEAGAALTPRYAAPEQLLGQPVTTATDVYAAGVVLHELLTGRLPYDAAATESSIAAWVQQVTQQPATAPGLDPDLDTVLLTALAKEPERRYRSVERFADDLERVLSNRPILARPVPAWRRAQLLVRRHRRSALAGGVVLVLLAAVAALAWQQWRESAAQRQRGDAVRGFVYAMLADAEPAQGQSDVTGREIVAAAAERARRDFASQPRLRGELLSELGRVSFRLNQADASVKLLDEALALLEVHAGADDPALARTRGVLARALIGRDAERATQLARQAVTDCRRDTADCADARAFAQYALAALASWQGRNAEALQHARAHVAETERAAGAEHPAMASALEALASLARNAGELHEAAATLERAQALASRITLKAANRDRMDLMQALVDVDLGRLAQARERLRLLVQRPANDLERSTQWRTLSMVEAALGELPAALQAAEHAVGLAGAGAPGAYARQAWATVASRMGRHAEAQAAFDQVAQGLLDSGFAPDSLSLARVQQLRARDWLRQRLPDAALRALDESATVEPQLPPLDRAQRAEARGCAWALAGRLDQAGAAYQAAEALRAPLQAVDHPDRRRLASLAEGLRAGAAPGCAGLV